MTVKMKRPDRHDIDGEKWGYCVKCFDRLYPSCQLARWKGKLYCTTHMSTKGHEMSDDFILTLDEGDRGEAI